MGVAVGGMVNVGGGGVALGVLGARVSAVAVRVVGAGDGVPEVAVGVEPGVEGAA